ncbi:MAG: LacI family DNA-binding transcriptional regulator [Shimia sp.]
MNLKQLAASLGLSQTTVSRALNGYPEVSEDTRRRIVAAADRHGYRPNARAKGLATGRAFAIGHVLPTSDQREMVNPVFGDFIAGAGETYAAHGFDMVLSVVADADQDRAYREMRAKGTVDGVILHAPGSHEPRIALMHELGLPFVVHGRASSEASGYSWIDVDNRRAVARATDLLLDLGHRRIALVNGREDRDFAARRRAGYVQALSARGLAPDPVLMETGEMTEMQGHAAARRMLALADAPSAFVTASMVSAIGVRRAIAEAGLTMGREVSVVTFDDVLSYMRNDAEVPLFTAVRSSVSEAGRLAAQMVLDRVAAPRRPPATRLLEAELILGASTGPAPASLRRTA